MPQALTSSSSSSGRLYEVMLPWGGLARLYLASKGVDGRFFCKSTINDEPRFTIREPGEIVMLLMVPHAYELGRSYGSDLAWSVVLYEDSLCFILTSFLVELKREEETDVY